MYFFLTSSKGLAYFNSIVKLHSLFTKVGALLYILYFKHFSFFYLIIHSSPCLLRLRLSVFVLRVIFKLESQVKQLEHENQARARYASSNTKTQPSGAGSVWRT